METKDKMFLWKHEDKVYTVLAKPRNKRIMIQTTDKGNFVITFKKLDDGKSDNPPCKWGVERGILTTKIMMSEEALLALMEGMAHIKGYRIVQDVANNGGNREETPQEVRYPESFLEWAAHNYIRLSQVWVHKYQNQMKSENFIKTYDLYLLWITMGKPKQ